MILLMVVLLSTISWPLAFNVTVTRFSLTLNDNVPAKAPALATVQFALAPRPYTSNVNAPGVVPVEHALIAPVVVSVTF